MIIGLSGYARSGKDTAAAGLEELGFQRVAFADKLRAFLYNLNPMCFVDGASTVYVQDVIDRYGWSGYKDTVYGDMIRVYLQRLGTECGRTLLGDQVWINAALDGAEGDVVVTDVRFPNEAQAIKDRGGMVVRIQRAGIGPANTHSSETALDKWKFDGLIHNNGGIEQLQTDLRFIVEYYGSWSSKTV